MKKSVTYISILIGGAFLLTSPSYASAESAYPEVQSFTMENSITDDVSACFAFDNTYGVVSDNRSELTADGFKKTNIDDQEAYCKNLGEASDLPDLYEKQFTYMGTYKLGNETKDFSIYNLPVFIGRHSIPATSSKYLKAQLQHDYEQEKISKDEYDIITFVLDTIVDDVIYQNPNEGGFMPNMNAAIVDYDKFMNLRESMGAESWVDIEFFKQLDSAILQKTESEKIIGHYISLPLSYPGGALLDQNGDWIESAPHLIKLTRTQFPSFMNIKANSAWLLSGGDRPGTEKRGKSMSPSYEWFYNSADAHGKIDSSTAHEESIDIHTVPTVEDDKYLTLNVGYSQYSFDFTLSGDLMPDAPITDDLKVPSTGASTADGNFVQAKMLIAVLLIAVPVTVLSVRRFIRRPKVTLSRKRNK